MERADRRNVFGVGVLWLRPIQVQRYLTGKSIAQSRLSLIFNAMAKIPMQFFILFIGAMVFVLFIFVKPPLLFQPVELQHVAADSAIPAVQQRYERRSRSARRPRSISAARNAGDQPRAQPACRSRFRNAQQS